MVLPPPAPQRGFWRRGLITAAICVLIALGHWLAGRSFGAALVFSQLIGLGCWLTVDGGRLLAAAWKVRRQPGDEAARQGWPGWPAMLGAIAFGVPLSYVGGGELAAALTGRSNLPGSGLPGTGGPAGEWGGTLLLLLLSLAVSLAITLWFYVRERLGSLQARADAADRLALHNQLRLLQSQLEPHMLFNTLANLRLLIALDPPRAQAMLDRLIALLRATLDGSRRDWQPLAAEFDRLADYLALMQVRMGERLSVRLDLPPALRERPVPPLLLQPLVENAIRHGLEPKRDGGAVEVSAAEGEGGGLCLVVRDTGIGLAAGSNADLATAAVVSGAPAAGADIRSSGGYGTRHVRERLAALYGAAARFELSNATDDRGGVLATLMLPAQPATALFPSGACR